MSFHEPRSDWCANTQASLSTCFISKAKENELRKLTIAILSELSPLPTALVGANPKPKSSAFAIADDLELTSTSILAASKAFLKDYREVFQEIAAAAAREQLPVAKQKDQRGEQLQLLLEKQRRRLKGEIYAMLDGAEVVSTADDSNAPAEKELWARFGATGPKENGKLSPWETSEEWNYSMVSSKKALRRLVRCLPGEEEHDH